MGQTTEGGKNQEVIICVQTRRQATFTMSLTTMCRNMRTAFSQKNSARGTAEQAAPLSDKTAKKTAETAVFLTERLALLYELNSGFRGIRFSAFGEQPAVYTTMVQHNAPLYDD